MSDVSLDDFLFIYYALGSQMFDYYHHSIFWTMHMTYDFSNLRSELCDLSNVYLKLYKLYISPISGTNCL